MDVDLGTMPSSAAPPPTFALAPRCTLGDAGNANARGRFRRVVVVSLLALCQCGPQSMTNREPSTTLRVGQTLVTVSRKDLIEIREALRARVRDHPDRRLLQPLADRAGAFITADGIAHVGVFALTAVGSELLLEFAPLPKEGQDDTFGFTAVVERVKGAWLVQRIERTHERWRSR